jgi:hypothetical protein
MRVFRYLRQLLQLPNQEPSAPSPYPTLFVKYTLIAVYGIASGVVGVTTLDLIAGETWALAWPALITAFAVTAFVGAQRSRRRQRFGLEVVATICLLALFAGYIVAIALRATLYGEFYRLPTALLPLILSVFPWSRLQSIVTAGRGRR